MLIAPLTPYLTFDGTCREAMTFYQQCLGGDLQIQTVAGTPAAEHMPAEAHNSVLHAILTNGNLVLMASDAGTQQITKGNMVSLSVNCQSAEEIAALFQQFSEGGVVTMPLQDTFWGATFGMLTDRFGIDWMFNYDKPAAQ
ncbi:VOC family protein [Hymenobacter cellulosivorans]|uniref:VOC family protein n=1 Tax=Hymenobacter cellulosivorans TaxID=2932249 RepID=A0ABY4FC34_9BACT|nr:VOC family protein [Hymenobacter cellulosivorans]UOQ53552.1 VOC family protein [Hymenobacter cellulosivorans]